jgi:predicted component of type VI protein secretion system
VATTSRTSDPPLISTEAVTAVAADVAARLRAEPFCFEFFQAVRLLERLLPGPDGGGGVRASGR